MAYILGIFCFSHVFLWSGVEHHLDINPTSNLFFLVAIVNATVNMMRPILADWGCGIHLVEDQVRRTTVACISSESSDVTVIQNPTRLVNTFSMSRRIELPLTRQIFHRSSRFMRCLHSYKIQIVKMFDQIGKTFSLKHFKFFKFLLKTLHLHKQEHVKKRNLIIALLDFHYMMSKNNRLVSIGQVSGNIVDKCSQSQRWQDTFSGSL